jgi:signal transduction histidine kinase/ActR/RegA family two-component response regulator
MKHPDNDRFAQIRGWAWNILASGLPADYDLDVLRKYFLLNLIGVVGSLFLALFSIIATSQGDTFLGLADLVILVFVLSLIYLLRTKRNHALIGLVGTLVTGCFFFFLVTYSSVGKSTYLWSLLYPLIALHLLGKQTGTYISLALMGASCLYFLWIANHDAYMIYDMSFIIRFVAVYLTLHLLGLVAEFVRERIQERLQDSGTELLESLQRVQESSAELAKSNRQLLTEIEERKRIEKALKNSEGFLDDVIESIQDGICVLNSDLTIRHTNSVMQQWYKQNMPLVGKKCYECYHNQQIPCDPCPTRRCLETGKPEREIVPGLPDSPVEWVELFSFPIKDKESGKITGAVEFVRDISVPKRLERQLSQAQKMEALGTLAGGIAHDFNNLLMGIQGRTSLMSMHTGENKTNLEHIHAIEEYVQSATNLTRQLLGTARGGKYDPRPTDLTELVSSSSAMFGRTRKEITIITDLHPVPVVAQIDREQLEQVLLNIYVNAWQAMPRGGTISLKTAVETLEPVHADPHGIIPGRYGKILISDSGLGMDDSTRQQVFDPFFTTKDKGRGTGLGLASAYGIIKNHGGFITVASTVNQGTTFNIYLPESDTQPTESISRDAGIATGSETILLVDDEQMIIEVGEAVLSELGYRVLTALGGEEAIDRVEDHQEQIDLVILDLIMPGMDGEATFDRLRKIHPDLPVILSSGYAIDGQATEIMRRGCNGFIQKPFSIADLSQKIRSVLAGQADL